MKNWSRQNTMEVISKSLQYDLQTQLVGKWLRKFDFLDCLPQRHIGRIGQITDTIFCAPGDALFSEGDAAHEMLIVARGFVLEIRDLGSSETVRAGVEHRSSGDTLGENCLFIREVRDTTAIASTHCELLSVRRDKFQAQCRSHNDLMLYYLATAAFLAVKHGQSETLRACLSQGLSANFQSLNGRTLLVQGVLCACRADNTLQSATLLNYSPSQGHEGASDTAAFQGPIRLYRQECVGVVKLLLACEADVNAKDPLTGSTAAHIACRAGDKELASMLLRQGANIFVADKRAQTVMDAAWASNNDDLIGLMRLVDLTASAKEGKIVEVKNALAEGVNPNWVHPKSGHTPLHAAAEKAELDILSLLLKAKADPNFGNKDTLRPLHAACAKNRIDIAEMLLAAKAMVNYAAGAVTPLGMAVQKGNMQFIELLCEKQANVNMMDNKGQTVLFGAVKKGKSEVVQSLLDAEADPAHEDHQGATVLDLAMQNKKSAGLVDMLEAVMEVRGLLSPHLSPKKG